MNKSNDHKKDNQDEDDNNNLDHGGWVVRTHASYSRGDGFESR
jgi:hypothetical protein